MTSRIFQQASGLRHRQALGRLMLVLAVATLFLTLQGTALVHSRQPTLVDSRRGLSYLKLGNGSSNVKQGAQSFFPI